jgi:hypothetical protein
MGFVWRLKDEAKCPAIAATIPMIVGMSVWETPDHLEHFVMEHGRTSRPPQGGVVFRARIAPSHHVDGGFDRRFDGVYVKLLPLRCRFAYRGRWLIELVVLLAGAAASWMGAYAAYVKLGKVN